MVRPSSEFWGDVWMSRATYHRALIHSSVDTLLCRLTPLFNMLAVVILVMFVILFLIRTIVVKLTNMQHCWNHDHCPCCYKILLCIAIKLHPTLWRIQRGPKGHAPPPLKFTTDWRKAVKVAVIVTQCFDVGNLAVIKFVTYSPPGKIMFNIVFCRNSSTFD